MKVLVAAAVLGLSFTQPLDGLGERSCADTAVIAKLGKSVYEGSLPTSPGYISLDGLFRAQLTIRRVLFGPAKRGVVAVEYSSHTELRGGGYALIYLDSNKGHGWTIARC